MFAFDKCVTGALGAVAAPLVGLLAERAFGGHDIISKGVAHDAASAAGRAEARANVRNAAALENALLWVMVCAMLLRCAVYGGLYWTLPRDRAAVARAKAEADAAAAPETELAKGLAPKDGQSSSSGGNGSGKGPQSSSSGGSISKSSALPGAGSMQRWPSADPPDQRHARSSLSRPSPKVGTQRERAAEGGVRCPCVDEVRTCSSWEV